MWDMHRLGRETHRLDAVMHRLDLDAPGARGAGVPASMSHLLRVGTC